MPYGATSLGELLQRQHPDRTRRRFCTLASGVVASLAGAGMPKCALADPITADHGRIVPPVPIPGIKVRCAGGDTASLRSVLLGKVTALHLMFTGCSTVCPIQGAIFQRLQTLLPPQTQVDLQLLSLSIDPDGDSPAAMLAWLKNFGANSAWIAAAPSAEDLDQVFALFGQGRNAVEAHSTQVNVIDREARLVWRSPPLPSPDAIASVLRKV
jgi:protein SCO1